jgi:hypothetical protein
VQPQVFQQRTTLSQGGLCKSSKSRQKHGALSLICECKTKFWSIVLCTHRGLPTRLQDLCSTYTPHVHEQGDYSSPAARTLRRPRRAPQLLVSGCTRSTSTLLCASTTHLRLHALYVNLAVRHDYSSLGRTGCSDLPRLCRASGCLGTSRRLVVDYFVFAARPGASAHRGARHVARRAARRRLLSLAQARRRLLHLRRASGCLGTSRGSSHGSSRRSWSTTSGSLSTTSPTPHVRVPWHVARPVTGFVVNYSACRNFLLRPHWLYFSHAVRRDYLSRGNTGSTSSTPHAATTSSSGRIALTIHLD